MSRRNLYAIERIVAELNQKLSAVTEAQAFEAGRQAGLHGANEVTAHYRYFTRPELTAAWERGQADGRREHAARAAK